MSASREKKIRQELAAQGVTDPKLIREAEAKAKARKTNLLYGIIAVVFVVVAAVLLVYNSGVLQRGATALTIDGEKYTPAQVDYYYATLRSNLVNGGYASYYGLDTSKPLTQQTVNDTAKMLLGIEDESEMTWDEYFRDSAVETLTLRVKAAKEAQAAGMVEDEHINEEIEATMEEVAGYAKQNGYSTKDYLKLIFGSNMTVDTFKEMVKLDDMASHYMSHYQEELTYSVSDLEAYYQDNRDTFDVADYDYVYFRGTAPSTTDADGNAVEASDEENAAAREAALKNAEEAMERYANGESLEDIAEALDGTFSAQTDVQKSSSAVSDWVFDSARQEGDISVVDSDPNVYVVLFRSVGRNDYATVDARHILFMVDTSELDSESETYEADLQALKDEAKQKAEDALAQWKAGAATEDSFAEMANELSDDGGSNTVGGLYEKIYKGQMVTEFNNFCFAEGRKAGDTGIVFNEGGYTGYHVIYYVGENVPYWQVEVETALRNSDYNEWTEGLIDSADVVLESGMKYVG